MPLFAFGVNHRTAPVALRERVSFPPERVDQALQELVSCQDVKEAAILSTCNRTDLYCGLTDGDGEHVLEWFRASHSLSQAEIKRYLYVYRAEAVVRHIMRVASGLDSLILGEPQILGQVKEAYHRALEHGTLGQVLSRLFQHTFSVAKQVRTDTAIGSSPVSVAFAAVTLAKQIFGDLNAHTALLIGAGETIELAARHLTHSGLGRLVVANRTLANAHRLAVAFEGYAIGLDEISSHLAEADIVISSTASDKPLLNLTAVQKAVKRRKHKPVFMVDIGVPRDIDPAVGNLEDIYLYSIDDLGAVIQENLQTRQEAARQAEEIIDTQVSHFMGWLGTLDVVSTICMFRANADSLRNETLYKAQQKLVAGVPPEQVLEFLAHTLTNKLIHLPTVGLRQAGYEGRNDLVDAAHILFGLADNTDPRANRR
jgi:glutamyl-tRNA reductase